MAITIHVGAVPGSRAKVTLPDGTSEYVEPGTSVHFMLTDDEPNISVEKVELPPESDGEELEA